MKNVLIFADPGIDDTLAIMYTLKHPDIRVIGIVSGYGNTARDKAANNIAYILDLAGQKEIPVIMGATRSCTGKTPVYYPEIHGPDGLGPITPPATFKGSFKEFSEIFKIVRSYDNVYILDLGRSTSLAVAIILDEGFIDQVSRFYIMGGAFLVPGNVTETAEANFHGDPVASHAILSTVPRISLFPLNVTNRAIVTSSHIDMITSSPTSGTGLTSILKDVHSFYDRAYKQKIPGLPGPPIHDLVAASLMMNPSFGRFLERDVGVETSGPFRGQSNADFRPDSKPGNHSPNIYLSIDYEAFIRDFIRIMSGI